jgi:serine/threonine protein phosphatase PrpC
VADGMGGHNAGEVAARMAVDAVTDYVRVAMIEGTRSRQPGASGRLVRSIRCLPLATSSGLQC